MRTHFTTDGIERLKHDAKILRRGTPLTQAAALDQIARREGWPNWALLHKNCPSQIPAQALKLVIEPFEPGDRGVYFLKLAVRDRKILAALEGAGGLSFELPPVPSNWIVRRFTELRSSQPDPFLDRRWPDAPRGRFVAGKFLCIVSTNGVQPPDIEAEIAAQLLPICAQFRDAAVQALETLLVTASGATPVRLFFSRPGPNGLHEIADLVFDTLEEAKTAALPPGAVAIGVPGPDGWWTFQAPFGWQPPMQ